MPERDANQPPEGYQWDYLGPDPNDQSGEKWGWINEDGKVWTPPAPERGANQLAAGTPTKYRTIVADPPWPYRSHPPTGKRNRLAGASHIYPTMTVEEIEALPVSALSEPNAHLYVWTTNNKMVEAHRVVSAWGFDTKTIITWNKTGPLGLGRWFRSRTEHVLFAARGTLPIAPERRQQNIFHAVNGAHSAKPDAFFDLVESVSPGPYLELFARRQRLGWDTWGNEALEHVNIDHVQ